MRVQILPEYCGIDGSRQSTIDSILILTFWPEKKGARIELVHINVDDSDFAGVSHGWEKYYWTPLREYLQKGTKPRKSRM